MSTTPVITDPNHEEFNPKLVKPNGVTTAGTKLYIYPKPHPACPDMVRCYLYHLDVHMTLLRADVMSLEAYAASIAESRTESTEKQELQEISEKLVANKKDDPDHSKAIAELAAAEAALPESEDPAQGKVVSKSKKKPVKGKKK